MANLGTTYREAGRLSESLALYQETLRLQKSKLGFDHPRRLTVMNEMGACLIKMKKYDEAVAILTECRTLREKRDPKDWWISQTKSQLGQALTGLQRYAEAEELLREANQRFAGEKDKIPGRYQGKIEEAAQALSDLDQAKSQKQKSQK
jgi:tetratricopeptide (TPR) repeat protein